MVTASARERCVAELSRGRIYGTVRVYACGPSVFKHQTARLMPCDGRAAAWSTNRPPPPMQRQNDCHRVAGRPRANRLSPGSEATEIRDTEHAFATTRSRQQNIIQISDPSKAISWFVHTRSRCTSTAYTGARTKHRGHRHRARTRRKRPLAHTCTPGNASCCTAVVRDEKGTMQPAFMHRGPRERAQGRAAEQGEGRFQPASPAPRWEGGWE